MALGEEPVQFLPLGGLGEVELLFAFLLGVFDLALVDRRSVPVRVFVLPLDVFDLTLAEQVHQLLVLARLGEVAFQRLTRHFRHGDFLEGIGLRQVHDPLGMMGYF